MHKSLIDHYYYSNIIPSSFPSIIFPLSSCLHSFPPSFSSNTDFITVYGKSRCLLMYLNTSQSHNQERFVDTPKRMNTLKLTCSDTFHTGTALGDTWINRCYISMTTLPLSLCLSLSLPRQLMYFQCYCRAIWTSVCIWVRVHVRMNVCVYTFFHSSVPAQTKLTHTHYDVTLRFRNKCTKKIKLECHFMHLSHKNSSVQ